MPTETDHAFVERLKDAVGSESLRKFAARINVSYSGFAAYISGKSEPSRPALIAIAKAAGVNVEWLATGQGDRNTRVIEVLDRELISALIVGAGDVYRHHGRALDLDRLADWVATRYPLIVRSQPSRAARDSMVEMALVELGLGFDKI